MYYSYTGDVSSDLELIKDFINELMEDIEKRINNEECLFDIKLILSELVINGALHGNRCVKSRRVKLTIELYKDGYTIEVEDEGEGIDYNLSKKKLKDNRFCGRGLVLVDGLSDELYIEENKIKAIKKANLL